MHTAQWLSYGQLAWIEPIIAPPENYASETELYSQAIKRHSTISPKTLLHLGSGAGINDFTFKRHFQITGLDISPGMIEVARQLNPGIPYHLGDMRTADLGQLFDAVAVPDSIGYMTTVDDLTRAVSTAHRHLKPGGVLLIVSYVKEEFRENNFAYTGSRGDIKITIFENNYIPGPEATTYEATMVYLVRRRGELEIYTDRHVCGLFSLQVWLDVLAGAGFEVVQERTDHLYDAHILGEGGYPLRMFIAKKAPFL